MAAELATVGFISPGSVVSRYTSCGKPGCRCQGDPPQRHGPYYQWSRAIAGKTVSRRLTEAEAELYQSWIANRRRLEQLIAKMEQTSAAARRTPPASSSPRKTTPDSEVSWSSSTHYPPVPRLLVKTNGPRWSPAGHKMVFAHLDATTTIGPYGLHHADLFEMNPDGRNVVQINATLEKDNMPAWDPDPRRIRASTVRGRGGLLPA